VKPAISTLANGLRIVTHTMPGIETTSLGVWVGVGARHEAPAEHGISHMLEHMAFKGTKSRSAQKIAEEIEEVGGELNATTGLESTAYFARVLKGDEAVALNLLADILQGSVFADDDLEREREVILQELAATRDSPEERVFDLVHDAAWPGQPVGRPVLGSKESIRSISKSDLHRFLERRYLPEIMVISAAGAVQHESMLRHAEALFGGLSGCGAGTAESAHYEGGIRWDSKAFEQCHVVLGFEGPSYREGGFYAAQVLSGLFGGGMSSRLFQEVRERRGLCYSIYSSAWSLNDTGMIGVHAATSPQSMTELIDVIGAEVSRLAEVKPTAGELVRSRAQLKAGLLMSLESSSARAEQMARQLLVHDRLIPTEELIAKVDAIDAEAVQELAIRFMGNKPSVAVVGAGRRSGDYAQAAERLLSN
jgi:predicted Zn-dependent peptidase